MHCINSTFGKLAAAVTIGLGAVLGASGCQRHMNAGPDAVVPPPPPDEAMALRDWQQSSAVYANTSTVAGNTGFFWMPKWDMPEWAYPLVDTPIFLANVVALPVSFIMTPPWNAVEYRAATVPPTFTAMPPLPPEPPQEDGRPSDLANPPAPSETAGGQPSEVAPPVVFPTQPAERPPHPTNDASQTLPRPNPNPPVPAAPAQQRTTGGEPVKPSTNLIVPSTNPTTPPMNK